MPAGGDQLHDKYVCCCCDVDVEQGALSIGVIELLVAGALLAYSACFVTPYTEDVVRAELFVSCVAWLAMGAVTAAGVAARNTVLLRLALFAHVAGVLLVLASAFAALMVAIGNGATSNLAVAGLAAGHIVDVLLMIWFTRVVFRARQYMKAGQRATVDAERGLPNGAVTEVRGGQPARTMQRAAADGPAN